MRRFSEMKRVKIYDTTLRDGTQGEDLSLSVNDKLRIAEKLDDLGIHYIEGGWPGSNPKDMEFFKEVRSLNLKRAKIASFGSTCRPDKNPEDDLNIKYLLYSHTPVVTIVGKSWDFHVKDALGIELEKNLDMIFSSIKYLKERVDEVFFDAEHFFDGFKENKDYAINTLVAAKDAGCDCVVLCDTNGGALLFEIEEVIKEVKEKIDVPFGIHTHNDCGIAVANTLLAVSLGADHVQGTINGYGERCGNADLCSVIPNLKLKMGIDCIDLSDLKKLKDISRFVAEIANLNPNKHAPYVGESAFAHKGGVHVSAIRRDPRTYEHIKPELVGNHQRVLISDLSGKSNILYKAREYGVELFANDPKTQEILKILKELEHQGFQFEGAEASFEILMKKAINQKKDYFELLGFRVISEKRREDEQPLSEATIMVKVGDRVEHTAACGNGPVNALDNALRKALEKFYPTLSKMKLSDYKVRVLSDGRGTAAKVRVLIESKDDRDSWGTVGVSENIIEASWQALVDSIEYKLMKDEKN